MVWINIIAQEIWNNAFELEGIDGQIPLITINEQYLKFYTVVYIHELCIIYIYLF